MRAFALGLVGALAMGSAALAADFIVVGSNEPSLKTGQTLNAGVHVALAPGHSLTLIRPSGEVITLQGAAGGAVLPGASAAETDGSKFEAVHALFARPPAGRTFGARRGFCPGSEVLDNIGAIVRANQAGCKSDARSAFQAYLQAHGVSATDADRLYTDTVVGAEEDAAR